MSTLSYFTEPMELTNYLIDLLEDSVIELSHVGMGDKLIPSYPAAVVEVGHKVKRHHSTHFFAVFYQVPITVYHARLDQNHKTRTEEDLALCGEIETLIESGEMNWGGRVVFAYVSDIIPGTIMRPKGEQVVGSRMIVEVETRQLFPRGG